jgi:hypothetical protein
MSQSLYFCSLLSLIAVCAIPVYSASIVDARATKGKFFVHMLHSGNFFPSAGQ